MSTARQTVGPAIAQWDDDEPLRWTMSETVGKGRRAEDKQYSFDLSQLVGGFRMSFLLALKEQFIDKRLTARLITIASDAYQVKQVLRACLDQFEQISKERGVASPVFERVDADFMTGLRAVKDTIPKPYLAGLKRFYKDRRQNGAIFDPTLHLGDFPNGSRSSGDDDHVRAVGQLRKNVLASALSRATLVQILNITEAAYEVGKLPLDLYAFSRLVLSRVARPESFRLLRLKDLRVDTAGGVDKYYLSITIPKARTAEAPRATVPLHSEVGRILAQQREAVAGRLAHLVAEKNVALSENLDHSTPYTIGDLPLFPAIGTRMFQATKDRLGMHPTSQNFITKYVSPLKALTGAKISHTALRHTMGTQLAIAGCSAPTIAAVLLHATNRSAAVYVDLMFEGAIDELSDSLESAFLEHFPVFTQFVSRSDVIDPDKRIVSTSVDSVRHETTGECGRRRACQFAPIVCYGCHRFKPCYDVDHAINLEVVNEELESARRGGLARQTEVKSFSHIANRIRVVINICEMKRAAVEHERARERAA